MNTNIFVVFVLTFTCSMTYFYGEVREFYSPTKTYKQKIKNLGRVIEKERSLHLLTTYEFLDFRNHVATLMPKAIQEKGQGEVSYPLRTLASVVQKGQSETVAQFRARSVMNEGKAFFREKKYEKANERFQTLLQKHPFSGHIPEAMLLLVEGHFNLSNYDQVVFYTNKMIEVYPESELTGYAMVRLGKVYEQQDRHSDAIDIYKTIILSFSDRGLASVAQGSLQAVEL